MPYKPKKPCAHPGCPVLTHSRYCPEHQKLADRQYEQYRRDPATRKRYGRNCSASAPNISRRTRCVNSA